MGLATDLYQLTMAAGYHRQGVRQRASFELFVRKLPPQRGYLIAAGLEQALHYLTRLRFEGPAIERLRALPALSGVDPSFFEMLEGFRFRGDVWAVPEGTPMIPGATILRVEGSLIEAQLVETYLLSVINYQTLVASKAARVVQAAEGRAVIDFGTRRGHGPQAGVYAARASYLAGFRGTSNVFAGSALEIPVLGTAAHSWTMAHDDEPTAFAEYHKTFPKGTVLLVDTYDALEGTRRATAIGPELRGIRLDSGDMGELAKQARAILDAAGCGNTRIIASSDLDEHKIRELLASGAPIDTFGVGTALTTVKDGPALSGVYKLVELGGVPRVKCSPGKRGWAGRKQVVREHDADGRIARDHLHRMDDVQSGLLTPAMLAGVLQPRPSLTASREACLAAVETLPPSARALLDPQPWELAPSDALERATAAARDRFAG